ncbi:restriction endonuclease [Brucella anthropi]|uniref:HNH endonuclease n=1 Tax=Brucella anthropi TaxID=529 RepID=UPI000448DBEC|nr:HNH endonuclease [Brucella anthropi]EXL04293.1 restriction endonuclease [Brucella anthropi]
MWERAIEPQYMGRFRIRQMRVEQEFKTWQANLSSFACTAEHLHAQANGGQDDPENIVAACEFCNSRRRSHTDPDEFNQIVAQSLGFQEAGHALMPKDMQWVQTAYDIRWKVMLFLNVRVIDVDLFCQTLPYTRIRKNHYNASRSDTMLFPAFDGDMHEDALTHVYQNHVVEQGTRLLLENLEHEQIVRDHFGAFVA